MKKTERILKLIREKRCDATVFTDPVNVRYSSGYNAPDGVVVITKDRSILFADPRYNGILPERTGLDVIDELIVTSAPLIESAYQVLHSSEVKSVALDTSVLTYDLVKKIKSVFDGLRCVGISGICRSMRESKDKYELEMIHKAQEITDSAFDHVLGVINPDMTENELAAEIEYFIRRKGAGIAFDTIAVSGIMSSVPHGTPRDEKLGVNTFITMDFGAVWNGYCSDMTRTVVIGDADDEMKKIYNIVLDAQRLGIDALKAGVKGSEVDFAARNYINSRGYGQYFTHSLGHSVGLEIHESPRLASKMKNIIPKNAVVTVEPGIYIAGKYGVRIEDLVIVKPDGVKNLTKSPKELIII